MSDPDNELQQGVLADLAEVNPLTHQPDLPNEASVSFITMPDVSEDGRIANRQVRQLWEVKKSFTRFKEGDVLFAKITPCMENGKGAWATNLVNDYGFGSTEFHVLRATKNADPGFIYHLSQMPALRSKAEAFFYGSAGQQRVNAEFFHRYPVVLLPLKEQRRIAEILTTVDRWIEKTEALIAKYQAIKQGMMADLFTRGIDENGQLRLSPEDDPDRYNTFTFGCLPNEWFVSKAAEVCQKISVGIVIQPAELYAEKGIPALRSANVRSYGIESANLVRISHQSNQEHSKSILKAGDIVIVRSGYPGTSASVPAEFDGCNCIDLLISRPKDYISSEFLAEWINSPFGKEQVLRRQGGLAQQHFNVAELRNLWVAVPPYAEQDRIMHQLRSLDESIRLEQLERNKIQLIKYGLMQDLLTGKVRVGTERLKEVLYQFEQRMHAC